CYLDGCLRRPGDHSRRQRIHLHCGRWRDHCHCGRASLMRNKALIGYAFTAALSGLVALEGMRTSTYLDSVGVPTICAGTTKGVKLGDTKTVEQCWTIAEAEYREYEKVVIDNIKVPLRANEQVALTYFCVNVGKYGCKGSTTFREFNA